MRSSAAVRTTFNTQNMMIRSFASSMSVLVVTTVEEVEKRPSVPQAISARKNRSGAGNRMEPPRNNTPTPSRATAMSPAISLLE
jgi:hypothetical protein